MLALEPLSAQDTTDNILVYGTIKEYFYGRRLPEALVVVKENGVVKKEIAPDLAGQYAFYLDFDADFSVHFSMNGMVTKYALINTKDIPIEDRFGGFAMNVDMTLFDMFEGFDVSILDGPIGISKFDSSSKTLEWDYEYTEVIQDSLRSIFDQFEEQENDQ